MRAFHNDEKIKSKYLARVRKHADADEIVKNNYLKNGKGCAIWCTIHKTKHSRYESELGVPEWLAHLKDRIFEGLPNERAKRWPLEFLEAINVGADLNKIRIPFLIFIIESSRSLFRNKKTLLAMDNLLLELKREDIDYSALKKAADAYASAASAYYFSEAALSAAAAATHASSDAAVSYSVAAFYAARRKGYIKISQKLLELIRECK